MCLKHSQDVINPEPPCTYGTALTEIFRADANSISASAPITVPFHFKWPVGAESYAAASLKTSSCFMSNSPLSSLSSKTIKIILTSCIERVHFLNCLLLLSIIDHFLVITGHFLSNYRSLERGIIWSRIYR